MDKPANNEIDPQNHYSAIEKLIVHHLRAKQLLTPPKSYTLKISGFSRMKPVTETIATRHKKPQEALPGNAADPWDETWIRRSFARPLTGRSMDIEIIGPKI